MITVVPGSTNQWFIVEVVTDNGISVDALNAATWPDTKVIWGENEIDITPVDLTDITDDHVDGGVLFIANGRYRLDLPDDPWTDEVLQVLITAETTNKRIICPDIQVKEPVYVYAMHGQTPDRGCTNTINTFVGEDYTARIYTKDTRNNPVDLTGIGDLEIVFELDENNPTDLHTLAEGDFTKTSTYIEFVIPASVNSTKRTLIWSCRKVTGKVVQLHGVVNVGYAALKDVP